MVVRQGLRAATVLVVGLAGCLFEVGGLSPTGGDAPDLAMSVPPGADLSSLPPGSDLSLPAGSDLSLLDLAAPPDLTVRNDLSQPSDLSQVCNLPSLAATVGPGPSLGITLSSVKVNGGGNTGHVAPGATFNVTAAYSITDSGGNNIDQILLGLAPDDTTAQGCLFNGRVHNETITGTATLQLTAPTAPGLYTVRFHYGQAFSCDTGWWTINGAPTAAQDFAAICVP